MKPKTAPDLDTNAMEAALGTAAVELQRHFVREHGERYRVEDLQAALTHWLELSVELLVEDVLFHTVEGDRSYTFNRRAFELQMQQLQSEATVTALRPAA
jgi:hypothetical protein